MKKWHLLYEILRFPLEILFIAVILVGIGNLLTNPSLGLAYLVEAEQVRFIGGIFQKVGTFLITNFPLLIMLKLVSRKSGSNITMLSAFSGYVAFLCATMYVAGGDLSSNAYSSILGLSLTTTSSSTLGTVTNYPLQTGIIGPVIAAMVTLWAYRTSRKKSEYGIFSFVTKDLSCFLRTLFLCGLTGIGIGFVWPFVVQEFNRIVQFIAIDTTNPINLIVYGIMDRISGIFDLSALIRQPFWYTSLGGSWVDVRGATITGDVAVWTSQLTGNGVVGMTGRFITPYFVLNLFAIPGMIWAMFSLERNPLEKGRVRTIAILATIVSILFGTLLPIEGMLLLLCPLLFLIHVGLTGVLFGLLQAFHIYLGYNSTATLVRTAQPGTLPEFLSYGMNSSFRTNVLWVVLIGVIFFIIYFAMTRFYFNHLALDLFNTGESERLVSNTIKALGGLENIKVSHSSISSLTVSVYDTTMIDFDRLKRLGAVKIFEFRAGYKLYFGSASTMLQNGIDQRIRKEKRDV